MSRRCTVVAVSVLVSATGLALEAAKPKPDLLANASFRCQTLSLALCATDRVRDDGAAYTYFYPATTEGASINGNGEFTLRFVPGAPEAGRMIQVDFGGQVQPPSCAPNCNPAGVPGNLNVTDGYLRTNVVTSAGAELAGGMLGMSCGSPYNSRLLITIPDFGGYWVVRFYEDAFPPSSFVQVTRNSRTWWTIDATGKQSVLLWNSDSKGRPVGAVQEGVYDMPFKIEVSVPSAPAFGNCN